MSRTLPDFPLECVLDGIPYFLHPKTFSTGKVGWHLSTKAEIGGERCQVSFCIVVIEKKITLHQEVDMGGGVTLITDGETAPDRSESTQAAEGAKPPRKTRKGG